jgi:CSLREA domain-containing protein
MNLANRRGQTLPGRVRTVAALVLVLLGRAAMVPAATFTVNSTVDVVDANLGDGLCQTLSGSCTLRAAIQQTNALGGMDTIVLPNLGTYTLTIPGTGEDASATGDLDIADELAIQGTGQPTIDGGSLDRVFQMFLPLGPVGIHGVTIVGGASPSGEDGGAIFNYADLTIEGCRILGNTSGATIPFGGGGGIANSGFLTLRDSLVSGNSSPGASGGGVASAGPATIERSTIDGNWAAAAGGGVGTTADLVIRESTVSNNFIVSGGLGAGLVINGGTTTVVDSTVSGNTLVNGTGAGIFFATGTALVVNNSTIARNDAGGSGGGGGIGSFFGPDQPITISNTILTDNSGGTSPDCNTTLTSAGFNLIARPSCPTSGDPTGNLIGGSANLGPLQDNGGSTFTHMLLAGSQALDAGNNVLAVGSGGPACAASDQRGGPRPMGARCDIGAVEPGCGNDVPDPGEICDSPCCDATCSANLPTGSPCDTGTPCSSCDLSGSCVVAPATTCKVPLGSKKAFLLLKNGGTPDKNVAIWKWQRGDTTTIEELGDPVTGTTEYQLCVFDSSNNVLMAASVPPGGLVPQCGTNPCWKTLANGNLKYGNKSALPGGIAQLTLTPGLGGKAKIALKAKGAGLQFPATPLADPLLHVQLQQRGSDRCWDASFGFYVLKNKVEGYKALGN